MDETTVPTETLTTVPTEFSAPSGETTSSETEAIVLVDYTPIIAESTSILSNIILCGALMIVGALCGIRFWR